VHCLEALGHPVGDRAGGRKKSSLSSYSRAIPEGQSISLPRRLPVGPDVKYQLHTFLPTNFGLAYHRLNASLSATVRSRAVLDFSFRRGEGINCISAATQPTYSSTTTTSSSSERWTRCSSSVRGISGSTPSASIPRSSWRPCLAHFLPLIPSTASRSKAHHSQVNTPDTLPIITCPNCHYCIQYEFLQH
jgi:hypothetical protein